MVILITIMHFFLVKAIDRMKDVIKLNHWQNLAGVTDLKTRSFGQMSMIYGSFSSTENQIPKENYRPRL